MKNFILEESILSASL